MNPSCRTLNAEVGPGCLLMMSSGFGSVKEIERESKQ
jgi:hypothetical protein